MIAPAIMGKPPVPPAIPQVDCPLRPVLDQGELGMEPVETERGAGMAMWPSKTHRRNGDHKMAALAFCVIAQKTAIVQATKAAEKFAR